MSDDRLGTLMVAFYGTDPESINFIGECVGIADHPTVIFAREPGCECTSHWAAHLCRPATKDEQIEYWKERALAVVGALPTPQEDG